MHSLATHTHTHTDLKEGGGVVGGGRRSKQMLWQVAQLNRQVARQRKVAPAMKLWAAKGCKGGVALKVGRMIGYEYSVAAEMFTLLAIKFLIKLKCCQTLHSDSAVRSATSSCSVAGGGKGQWVVEGAVVGVTGCLCGLRSRSGIRSHMWCETCVAFVVAGIPPFWVSYAFIPGLIHSYIHSVTFISFHCVPHRPPPLPLRPHAA